MLLVLNKMKNYFRSTRNITRLTIVLIAIEVAMILSGTYLLYSCNQNLQNAEEKRNYYQELAGELGDTSDFLTKQVRYFAVTGDIQYFYNYWYEAEITRTRENVVKEIKKSVIPESERNLLSNAKSYSDALMDLEIHSMQYTLKAYDIKADDFKDDDIIYSWIVRVLDKESWELYEESSSWRNKEKKDKEPVFLGEDIDSIKRKEKDHALKEKGINLLFGKVYKEYKENIESFVKQFQSKMDQRLNEEVRQAEKQEHRTIILQVIFVCCENCIMMVLLYFLNVLFVKPLENYTKEIEKSNVNNLPSVRAEGTWELEYFGNIFNQLARNLSSELSFRKQIEEVMRKAKEQADEANKMKSDFLSMVSHEIRTPLHAITGYLFLLEDSNLEPEQMEYVENAQFATNILLEEISEILDFSKIEAGKMLIENKNFNFRKLIREIKSVLENEAGTRGIELQFNVSDDIPEYLIGDPLRLKQVLTNLIYNGIKFTKVGFVKLCVDIQDKQSLDHIVLSFIVEDSGIGIKKEMQDKIFEAFTQSDASVTRKYGGTGLGLPISKKIVEMSSHEKYTITVESQEGVGSRFYFCMEFGIGKR